MHIMISNHDIAYNWVEEHYSLWFKSEEFPPWVDAVGHFNHLVTEVLELIDTRTEICNGKRVVKSAYLTKAIIRYGLRI